MNLIIIEGENGKSEHQFWKELKRNLFSSEVQIAFAESNSKIPRVLESILVELTDRYRDYGEDSNILICYDTTALDREVLLIKKALKEVLRKLEPGIKVKILSYYCFEDCLLQMNYFMQWLFSEERISQDKNGFNALYDEYKRLGLDNRGLCWQDSEFLNDWVRSNIEPEHGEYNFVSKEKVAGKILSTISNDSFFRTNKGILGNCWFRDCTDLTCDLAYAEKGVNSNGKMLPAREIQRRLTEWRCGLLDSKLTTQQKAEILLKDSILEEICELDWLF